MYTTAVNSYLEHTQGFDFASSKSGIPPTAVGGWFSSYLEHTPGFDFSSSKVGNTTNGSWWMVQINLLTGQPPFANPTNGSWWMLHFQPL
ncbi:MAG TPA: hypothetical protein VFZ22_14450 [Pyrinomonadaceae bacterium]|nr:hypothetical protein [Pyrinomonadaceae bacterium]